MAGAGGQLALPFPISQHCTFDNFQMGVNSELLARLHGMPEEPGFVGIWLWGPRGAGVSHLLQASCQQDAQWDRQVAYLPLASLGQAPEILDGMEGCDLVAIDDLQRWAAQPALEAALLGFYESMLTRQCHLLIGASMPVVTSAFRLADLKSRLAGLTAYQVQPLDDQGKAQLLRRLAAERGLELTDAVLSFWLARSDRAVDRLLAQFEVVDAAAMSAQRTVTIPLLKDVLVL